MKKTCNDLLVKDCPCINYRTIKKRKDMGYPFMTQNHYVHSKKHKKQRKSSFMTVLHLEVTVRQSTQS